MIPERLQTLLASPGKAAVAFSGGVDSGLLLALTAKILGPEKVLALTATGPIFPPEETLLARETAKRLKVRHLEVPFEALELPAFRKNPSDRCYHCKKALFRLFLEKAREAGFRVLWDGTQADDLRENRPGLRALRELGVKSPLAEAGLGKKEVRTLAESLGLPQSGKPPAPCLATRFPPGEPVTREGLKKVYEAEKALGELLRFSPLRVRYLRGEARIEVRSCDMERVWERREEVLAVLSPLGFRRVSLDLLGYAMEPISQIT